VCHRHTSTLCVTGRGDSVDGVATGWTVGFEPRWRARGFLFLIPVWTSPGAHPSLLTVGNGPLYWEHSIRGMELFTHPNVVLILRISWSLPVLLLCATIGMSCSALFLIHMCSWLFMNVTFIYQHKRKATNIKGVKS